MNEWMDEWKDAYERVGGLLRGCITESVCESYNSRDGRMLSAV